MHTYLGDGLSIIYLILFLLFIAGNLYFPRVFIIFISVKWVAWVVTTMNVWPYSLSLGVYVLHYIHCVCIVYTIHIHTLIHPPIHLLTHSFTHPDTFVHHVYRGYLLLLLIIAARDKIDEEKNGISRPKSHVMNICLLFAANGQYFITPYYMYTRSRFQTIDFRVECTSI